jgi:hypothetical protein
MQTITTIGLDIAKSVFQVHGVDAAGQVVIRRQLKRRYVLAFFQKLPPCLVGIEACASSHYWSRELAQLRQDATKNLIIHPRGVDRVVGARPVSVARGVRLLRPEDRESRLLVRQDVVHEDIGQVCKPAPGQSAAAIERIAGVSVLESCNWDWRGRIAVIFREDQRTRL